MDSNILKELTENVVILRQAVYISMCADIHNLLYMNYNRFYNPS